MYLTIQNKDLVYTPLEKPIVVNYWLEPVDPSLKAEEYSTDPIDPQFAIIDSGALKTFPKTEAEEGDSMSGWLWVGFFLALIASVTAAIVYYLMRQRIKKLQL